ncbi:hypothetical protein RHSIM_Rhsim08G0182300 [Rhododendron simsii]|uniref:Uncharacterized protein n=1 Tax=Rhododendron simsii TaxID=118357 RepID=A0A834GKC7_RHOSS|nr:hypothetical protein RHSIM_Rhsim08G0182300 [Rhododendron simsii]
MEEKGKSIITIILRISLPSRSNGDIRPVSVPSNFLQTPALRANNLVSHPLPPSHRPLPPAQMLGNSLIISRPLERVQRSSEAAKQGNLIPLYRSIPSGHLTPETAYRCLVKEDKRDAPSFLFESVEPGCQQVGLSNVVKVGLFLFGLFSSDFFKKRLWEARSHNVLMSSLKHFVTLGGIGAEFCGMYGVMDRASMAGYLTEPRWNPAGARSSWRRRQRPLSEAAEPGNLIPLYQSILSDQLTPVLAYRCLVKEDERDAPSFLFESVDPAGLHQTSSLGWYSVIRAQPCMEIVAKENMVTIMDQREGWRTEKFVEDPMVFLGGLWTSGSPSVVMSSLKHFVKAFVIHWVQLDQLSSVEEAFNVGMNQLNTLVSRVPDDIVPQRFERRTFADPFEVYRALRIVDPSPYMTYLQARGCILVASSPEILARAKKVTSESLDHLSSWDALRAALPVGTVSGVPKEARPRLGASTPPSCTLEKTHGILHKLLSSTLFPPIDNGRYILIGAQPAVEFVAKENFVTVIDGWEGSRREEFVEDPMRLLKCMMEKWKPQPLVGGLDTSPTTPFIYVEKKLSFFSAPKDDRCLPDIDVCLYDDVILFDQKSLGKILLSGDEKERAKHMRMLDLEKNDISKVCKADYVTLEKIGRLSSTPVTGELFEHLSCWDVLQVALPSVVVSGAPKAKAIELIDQLEQSRRGPYGGGVGCISFFGDMEMSVTSDLIVFKTGTRVAHIQLGVTIKEAL